MSEQSVVQGSNSASSADMAVVEGPKFRAALEKLSPVLSAMTREQYPLVVNVDIPTVASLLLGKALLRIKSFRPAIVEQLPKYNVESFDMLEDVVMALSHANTLYNAAYGSAPLLQEAHQKAAERYEVLLAEAEAAVIRKKMPGDRLKDLRPNMGSRNVAGNLFTVAQMFRANWANLKGKTGVTEEELDAADREAETLTRAIGDREGAPEAVTAAADMQQRAFNLFIKTYSHVERALTYLLWDEREVASVLPPIYTGKGPGKRKMGQETPAEPRPAPAPAPGGQHAVPTPSPLPTGLPGGDPLEDAE